MTPDCKTGRNILISTTSTKWNQTAATASNCINCSCPWQSRLPRWHNGPHPALAPNPPGQPSPHRYPAPGGLTQLLPPWAPHWPSPGTGQRRQQARECFGFTSHGLDKPLPPPLLRRQKFISSTYFPKHVFAFRSVFYSFSKSKLELHTSTDPLARQESGQPRACTPPCPARRSKCLPDRLQRLCGTRAAELSPRAGNHTPQPKRAIGSLEGSQRGGVPGLGLRREEGIHMTEDFLAVTHQFFPEPSLYIQGVFSYLKRGFSDKLPAAGTGALSCFLASPQLVFNRDKLVVQV